MGLTLPTCEGTMVISRPSSSFTIVMQSLRYLTLLSRTAGSAWIRSRPANIKDTDPQHLTPCSRSSAPTSLVSYLSGSPAISMDSYPYFASLRIVTSIGSALIQLCIERNISNLLLILLTAYCVFFFYRQDAKSRQGPPRFLWFYVSRSTFYSVAHRPS